MGLMDTIGIAARGLQVASADLNVTGANIQNAQTAGYRLKTLNQVQRAAGGVDIAGINRILDPFLLKQNSVRDLGFCI